MARKKEDLLGPIGNDGVDYIRRRLKRRVELERGITMRSREIDKLLRCLDEKADFSHVEGLRDEAFVEVGAPMWRLEIEPLMVERHGAWRYDGRPEVLTKDLQRAAALYAMMHTMDALLSECGFHTVRPREERLDDAAFYAVPSSER